MDINYSILAYVKGLVVLCENSLNKEKPKKSLFKKQKKSNRKYIHVTVNNIEIHDLTFDFFSKLEFKDKKILVDCYSKMALGSAASYFNKTELNSFKKLYDMMLNEFKSYENTLQKDIKITS